ncbi:hypothetical protein [Nocardia sp. SC052]|uniref:hypothetical protein n=1 Tax=Nocardia sichangensis TaxID=3385975 RepID=UPI00399FDC85
MAATEMTQYKPPTRIEALRAMGRGDRIFTIVIGVLSVITAAFIPIHVVRMIVTDYADEWYDLITLMVVASYFSAILSSDYWRYRARAAERHIADSAQQSRTTNGPIVITDAAGRIESVSGLNPDLLR